MILADTQSFTNFIIQADTEKMEDYELGGVDLGDTSQGLRAKLWQMRVENGNVILSDGGVIQYTLFSAPSITEASVSFDQNMRPVVVYVESGITKLYWYDPTEQDQVVDVLGSDIRSPKASLDDSRPETISNSMVVVSYIRNGWLCVRTQVDRYTTETALKEVDPSTLIVKTGMTLGNRFRWQLASQSEVSPEAFVAAALSAHNPSSYNLQHKPLPLSANGQAPVNSVATEGGVVVKNKTTSGEWVDVAVFTTWLRKVIGQQVLQALSDNPTPAKIEAAITSCLQLGVRIGGITRYVVRQTPSQERSKPHFEWKAQLSGAINNVTISGTVEP